MFRPLCESAKCGRRCIDDLCQIGETLCGIDFDGPDFREYASDLDDEPADIEPDWNAEDDEEFEESLERYFRYYEA